MRTAGWRSAPLEAERRVFDEIIVRAVARRFHRNVTDELLDGIAAAAGCAAVGRLCLLDDAMMHELAARGGFLQSESLLDIGCGRGFLARWLRLSGYAGHYTGIDRIGDAVVATRRAVPGAEIVEADFRKHPWHQQFDAIVALESVGSSLDDDGARAFASAVSAAGTVTLTSCSLAGNAAARTARLRQTARSHFAEIAISDWSAEAASFARKLYRALLGAQLPGEIVDRSRYEAESVLAAISQRRFSYLVAFASGPLARDDVVAKGSLAQGL